MSEPNRYPVDLDTVTPAQIENMRVSELREALERALSDLRRERGKQEMWSRRVTETEGGLAEMELKVEAREATIRELREALSLERTRVAVLTGTEAVVQHHDREWFVNESRSDDDITTYDLARLARVLGKLEG